MSLSRCKPFELFSIWKDIVSGVFDKGLKLWDLLNGTFVGSFNGNIESIY